MLWLVPLASMLAAALALGLRGRAALAAWGTVAMLGALGLSLAAVLGGWAGRWDFGPQITLLAGLAPASAVVLCLVPAVALPVVLFAAVHEARAGLTRLVALLLFFAGAMQLLVVADDLLTLLIGWELVGACSWALIAHAWREPENPRSATLAMLVTRFGDLGLFLAAMTTFAASGSFALARIGTLQGWPLHLVAAGLLLACAAKSAQLPFSFWLFRAMAGPSSVSALLHAATMVAAGAYLLIRLHPMLAGAGWLAPAVLGIGLATAIGGGLVAVLQPHVKRLLAASTSAHYGLMWVAVGAGYPLVALLHLVVHACFKALLFLSAGLAASAGGSALLGDLGLGRRLPRLALLSLAGTLALAGVPPLAGAWSKELIGAAAEHWSPWLAAGVLLAGTLSACYAARWQWQVLGPADEERGALHERPGRDALAAVALLAAALLALSLLLAPPVRDQLLPDLGLRLPDASPWMTAGALLTLVIGLYAARWLVASRPRLGERGADGALADWLGLPRLVDRAVSRPLARLSSGAARFDDAVVDALPTRIARLAGSLAERLARGDDRVVDAGVRRAAALGSWSAGVTARGIERVMDGAAEGLAWLTDGAGRDLRRLETGLAHHYLVWIATGAAGMAVLVLLGA
jgi:NADH:ubiquinone oxidoreductase subunit 5 (subunit L)/multisubunit Na+/H+ antiporter MnhA subunit